MRDPLKETLIDMPTDATEYAKLFSQTFTYKWFRSLKIIWIKRILCPESKFPYNTFCHSHSETNALLWIKMGLL